MQFSVFIPVFNGAAWIERAIDSVMNQTHEDWELVVGDNASTDKTGDIALGFGDPRIRYHRWETYSEISENFNRTLSLCRGEWAQFLAADDRIDRRCLERMAEQIAIGARRSGRLAMVVTACRRVSPDGRPADREWYRHGQIATFRNGFYDSGEWLTAVAAPGAMPWNSGSVALNREILNEIGTMFRPETGVCADLELNLRIAAYGDTAYIAEPLLDFTVHGASDGVARVRRNLERDEPLGPMGLAMVAGLRVHEYHRGISRAERDAIRAAVARELLSRALLHRHHSGGRGRRGAVKDVARAAWWSLPTLAQPKQVAKAAGAVLLPRAMIQRSLNAVERRRRRTVAETERAGLA